MKKIQVVGAIIIYNNLILCMQRNKGKRDYVSYKFEFPGGKVEPGETRPEALMRELREEMDMNINITDDDFFMTVEYAYEDFEIEMHTYILRPQNPEFNRKEHIDHKWLPKEELMTLDWVPADIAVVKKLQETL